MKIPVFVSRPTNLKADQEKTRSAVFYALNDYGLEPRALGKSDYPTRLPLREVLTIAKHCAGSLVLGFEQQFSPTIEIRRSLPKTKGGGTASDVSYPTPWNNLEAGILYALGLPQLAFRDPTISGGIFDNGVSDVFIHPTPAVDSKKKFEKPVNDVFLKWQSDVRRHYYDEGTQGVATNRLPAKSRKCHDNSTINLKIRARSQAACGSTLTLGTRGSSHDEAERVQGPRVQEHLGFRPHQG